MYDQKDILVLETQIQQRVTELREQGREQTAKKMSRDQASSNKHTEKLTYCDFQKIVLDFQLQEHEKFLAKFTALFKEVDYDNNGSINESEFRDLLSSMKVLETEEEVLFLLQAVDPYNNQRLTFSEVVHLFSSHLVPGEGK